jgi:hypothetical protein
MTGLFGMPANMIELIIDSLAGLALALRLADRRIPLLDQALAVKICGYAEIIKSTPGQVGVYWNNDRTDMLVETKSSNPRIPLKIAHRLVQR